MSSGTTPATESAPGHALLTDLYELTMAAAAWKAGRTEDEAVFHLYFRRLPFQGGFAVAAGLGPALEEISRFRFGPDELAALRGLGAPGGGSLFPEGFLDWLSNLSLSLDVDAIPEGTVVFPNEPLLRVSGPLVEAQILESLLLNIVNFQTLVATKSARIRIAAKGDPVLEFGLRRAQGVDGALAASRAAYVGGAAATSNVLAGTRYGIPVRGTHAHSWVMSWDTEREAFEAFADAHPKNAIFLVDTYDTLDGVRNAVAVGQEMRSKGHELAGIRLDSGDLAALSIEARRILDEGGFPNASISASNDLDEHVIKSLKEQGARIDTWGVGTKLVTAYDEPALGGVYKLAALKRKGGAWVDKVKLSEQAAKTSTPGRHQVRRFRSENGTFAGDAIFDLGRAPAAGARVVVVDPLDGTRRTAFAAGTPAEDLLVPAVRQGKVVYQTPTLRESRDRALAQVKALPEGTKRFLNPHLYPVGLEESLYERRTRLILAARGFGG